MCETYHWREFSRSVEWEAGILKRPTQYERRRRGWHRHFGLGTAIGLAINITDRASIRTRLDQVALAYVGVDSICVITGFFVPSSVSSSDHSHA